MDHSYVRKKVKNLSIEEKAFILAWNNSEKYSKDYPARFSHSKSIINHYVKWVRKWIIFSKWLFWAFRCINSSKSMGMTLITEKIWIKWLFCSQTNKKTWSKRFFLCKNQRFFENLLYKLEVFEFEDCFSETVVLFKTANNIKS